MGVTQVFQKIFRAFCSVKLAVFVILAIAASVAAGTIYESIYDTPTAQFWIYRSIWFHGILFLLGVNILCVALSRLPWKRRHIPFLMAHAGILMLLIGSWMTEQFGLDGSLRVTERETTGIVDMDSALLVMSERTQGMNIGMPEVKTFRIPWIPPGARFKSISSRDFGLNFSLAVDRFLPHADPIFDFHPVEKIHGQNDQNIQGFAAVRIRVSGGPMRISQEYQLWAGDQGWRSVQAGPAMLALDLSTEPTQDSANGQPTLFLRSNPDGGLRYRAFASSGSIRKGVLKPGQVSGAVIDPDWKGVKITILEWKPKASLITSYKESRVQFGEAAPPSAIHLTSEGSGVWLGLGERATLHTQGKTIDLAYYPQRVVLPFSIRLEHFRIDHYDGTRDPSSYSSEVAVVDAGVPEKKQVISMNEPLEYKGITLYQSSFEDAMPRPITSIFSVNRDPGRRWKYLGSLLIVFGSILLFAMKYRKAKQAPQR